MTEANDPINAIVRPLQAEVKYKGITKREYFATMAMQGLLGSPKCSHSLPHLTYAEQAVAYADALIQALNQ